MIHLPDNDGQVGDYDVCDFAWFTIWCQDFNVTFTEIAIPRDIYVSSLYSYIHYCVAVIRIICFHASWVQVDKEEDVQLGKTIVCDAPDDDDDDDGVSGRQTLHVL